MSQAPTPASVPSRQASDAGQGERAPHVADVLAAAVLATPGVAGLHGGRYGEIGTYLPGRRVVGVRVDDDTVELHLIVEPSYLPGVGDAAREAVRLIAQGRDVHVVVADVIDPHTSAEIDRSAGREEHPS